VEISGGQGPFQFQWDNGQVGTEQVENLATGGHALTVTDANGCSLVLFFQIETYPASAVPVYCEPRIYAPTAFSPNGDGTNDRFTLYGNTRVLEIKLLQVYDVWGELVFEARSLPLNEEGRGWDGTFRGGPLKPAMFLWRAIVQYEDGKEEVLRGDFLLVR
jgi:gliding motility-associated-like protein